MVARQFPVDGLCFLASIDERADLIGGSRNRDDDETWCGFSPSVYVWTMFDCSTEVGPGFC